MNVLSLEAVGVSYPGPGGDTWAVRNVSMSAPGGRITAVVGPSGSGKSTVLSVAGLLQRPTEGRIRCGGIDVTDSPEAGRLALRRDGVGMVFQSGVLVEHLSVLENVMLPLLADSTRHATARATDLLGRMGLCAHAGKLPHQLSGGQAQRVAICRAVVRRPRLLLADEPTANLDSQSADVVRSVLRDLAADGTAVVVATHDPVTADWADDVLALGRILEGRR